MTTTRRPVLAKGAVAVVLLAGCTGTSRSVATPSPGSAVAPVVPVQSPAPTGGFAYLPFTTVAQITASQRRAYAVLLAEEKGLGPVLQATAPVMHMIVRDGYAILGANRGEVKYSVGANSVRVAIEAFKPSEYSLYVAGAVGGDFISACAGAHPPYINCVHTALAHGVSAWAYSEVDQDAAGTATYGPRTPIQARFVWLVNADRSTLWALTEMDFGQGQVVASRPPGDVRPLRAECC